MWTEFYTDAFANGGGLGEGAVVFVFDDNLGSETLPDGFAIQQKKGKKPEKVEINDLWWEEPDSEDATGATLDPFYNTMYKTWLKKAKEGKGDDEDASQGKDSRQGEDDEETAQADYRLINLPESLSSNKVAGFAVSDGKVVSLEKDNGDDGLLPDGTSAGDTGGGGAPCKPGPGNVIGGDKDNHPQKLRIINAPTVCNFRNEHETTIAGKKYGMGFKDNKGLIKGIGFSDDYDLKKGYSCARICEGNLIIPFADTKCTRVDPRQGMDFESQVGGSHVDGSQADGRQADGSQVDPKPQTTGISGVIRGIQYISSIDKTSSTDNTTQTRANNTGASDGSGGNDSSGSNTDKSSDVDPYIEKGIIYIPKNTAPLCNFFNKKEGAEGGGGSDVDNPGIIKSIEFSGDFSNPEQSGARIIKGNFILPYADTTSIEGGPTPGGVVRDVQLLSREDSGEASTPYIQQGTIYIPQIPEPLCNYNNGGSNADGGAIEDNDGIIRSLRFCQHEGTGKGLKISEGVIQIPYADTIVSNTDAPATSPDDGLFGDGGVVRGIEYMSSVDGSNVDGSSPQPYIEEGIIYVPKPGGEIDGVAIVDKSGNPTEYKKFKDFEKGKYYRIARSPYGFNSGQTDLPISIMMCVSEQTMADGKAAKFLQFRVFSTYYYDQVWGDVNDDELVEAWENALAAP